MVATWILRQTRVSSLARCRTSWTTWVPWIQRDWGTDVPTLHQRQPAQQSLGDASGQQQAAWNNYRRLVPTYLYLTCCDLDGEHCKYQEIGGRWLAKKWKQTMETIMLKFELWPIRDHTKLWSLETNIEGVERVVCVHFAGGSFLMVPQGALWVLVHPHWSSSPMIKQ